MILLNKANEFYKLDGYLNLLQGMTDSHCLNVKLSNFSNAKLANCPQSDFKYDEKLSVIGIFYEEGVVGETGCSDQARIFGLRGLISA